MVGVWLSKAELCTGLGDRAFAVGSVGAWHCGGAPKSLKQLPATSGPPMPSESEPGGTGGATRASMLWIQPRQQADAKLSKNVWSC